jgi:rhamnosyltransferase
MINIAILIATHNGEKFIAEQLATIKGQVDVTTTIFFSDDCSSDNSRQIALGADCTDLNPDNLEFGSATKNFAHLICSFNSYSSFDYVCLSDQDDIWLPDKLISATMKMRSNNCSAYSGSYYLFEQNKNSCKYINKWSGNLLTDIFFCSPGPGFTYVFDVSTFIFLREFLIDKHEDFSNLRWHDWGISVILRSFGYKWYIDSQPYALYRIHESNDTGQLNNFKQFTIRIEFLFSGKFRHEILKLTRLVNNKFLENIINKFGFFERVYIILNINKFRKKFLDRFSLLLWAIFGR